MARPRVRRKTRNPSLKVSRKQKHPMKISFAGVHQLVQENWDKKKTLRENYETLGLIPKLMGAAGGQGSLANARFSEEKERMAQQMMPEQVDKEIEWRVIERDEHGLPIGSDPSRQVSIQTLPVDNSIIEEVDNEVEPPKFIDDRVTALGAKVNLKKLRNVRLDTKKDFEEKEKDNSTRTLKNPIVAAMEEEAKQVVQIIRKPSDHEELVLEALQRKYGQDYKAMARDLKLNKYQFTPGQLKKKFERVALKKHGISRVVKENSL